MISPQRRMFPLLSPGLICTVCTVTSPRNLLLSIAHWYPLPSVVKPCPMLFITHHGIVDVLNSSQRLTYQYPMITHRIPTESSFCIGGLTLTTSNLIIEGYFPLCDWTRRRWFWFLSALIPTRLKTLCVGVIAQSALEDFHTDNPEGSQFLTDSFSTPATVSR